VSILNSGKEEDWLAARNFCRQRCMDSVSVETSPENEWVKQRLVDGKGENLRVQRPDGKEIKILLASKSIKNQSRDMNLNRIKSHRTYVHALCICVTSLRHVTQIFTLRIGNFFAAGFWHIPTRKSLIVVFMGVQVSKVSKIYLGATRKKLLYSASQLSFNFR
jgi:hypothetical protein